jgi:hypothetical protein
VSNSWLNRTQYRQCTMVSSEERQSTISARCSTEGWMIGTHVVVAVTDPKGNLPCMLHRCVLRQPSLQAFLPVPGYEPDWSCWSSTDAITGRVALAASPLPEYVPRQPHPMYDDPLFLPGKPARSACLYVSSSSNASWTTAMMVTGETVFGARQNWPDFGGGKL